MAPPTNRRELCLGITAWALAGPALADAVVVGTVARLRGEAVAQSADGAKRRLEADAQVLEGDTLITGAGTVLRVAFLDDSYLSLGPRSHFVIEQYSFRNHKGGMLLRISKGVFRFVSGLFAQQRPSDFELQTQVASIGIRGTDFAGEVEPDSARIVLLKPEDDRPSAIEVRNAFGAVVIDQPGYGTEIPDPNSPPSPPRRMTLDTLNRMMRNLSQIQRMTTRPLRR